MFAEIEALGLGEAVSHDNGWVGLLIQTYCVNIVQSIVMDEAAIWSKVETVLVEVLSLSVLNITKFFTLNLYL